MKRLKASVEDKIIESNIPETKISNAEAKKKSSITSQKQVPRLTKVYTFKYLNLRKKMVSFLRSQKENDHLILLPVIIATHASLVINHQEKAASSSKITSPKLRMKYLLLTMAC